MDRKCLRNKLSFFS